MRDGLVGAVMGSDDQIEFQFIERALLLLVKVILYIPFFPISI